MGWQGYPPRVQDHLLGSKPLNRIATLTTRLGCCNTDTIQTVVSGKRRQVSTQPREQQLVGYTSLASLEGAVMDLGADTLPLTPLEYREK